VQNGHGRWNPLRHGIPGSDRRGYAACASDRADTCVRPRVHGQANACMRTHRRRQLAHATQRTHRHESNHRRPWI
jgi:hypothetical protein